MGITLLVLLVGCATAAPFAYIPHMCNGKVMVIDTATDTVVATIPAQQGPLGAAVNPSGTRVYVTNCGSKTVSVIDTATNTIIDTIPVGFEPEGIAVNPTGTRVYVANRAGRSVSVIDTATDTVVATIGVGSGPLGIAVNPSGTRVYIANTYGNTISVIDTAKNSVTATVTVGDNPFGLAINPAGTRVYVANRVSNTVSVIDTAKNTVIATINVGTNPHGLAINPAGTRVYVANYVADHVYGTVSVIDTATNTVIATVNVGISPYGIDVNPAGTKVYVTDHYSDKVSVIDTDKNTVITSVTVLISPVAFGKFIGPATAPATMTLLLTPVTATTPKGTPYTLTATARDAGNNLVKGIVVNFAVTTGPGGGTTGTSTTDDKGKALFTYTSTTAGTDTIVANFVDPTFGTITSNTASNIWNEGSVVDFITNVSTGNAPLSVKFTDTSPIIPVTSNEALGDITWFDTSAASCMVSNEAPRVVFIPSANNLNAPRPVKILDTSLTSPTMWNWSFGDGTWFNTTDENLKNPIYTYTVPGTYIAQLTLCNNGLCNTTVPGKTITVKASGNSLPTVKFVTNVSSGYAPLTVGFADGSSGNPNMWNWSFGDGTWFNTTTVTLKNPKHTYTSAGTYPVKLIVCNAFGCNTIAPDKTITVNLLPLPSVNYIATPGTGNAPLTVGFTDGSSGNPDMWNWSFGDGTWFNTTTASLKNPTYTYTSAGTYQVKLIACNAVGCNTTGPVKTITVNLLPQPSVNFAANISSGYAPLTVGFIDGSSGNPDMWNWSFGDGTWFNTTTASLRNPTYTYTSAGTYPVKLVACNAAGCNTTGLVKPVTVSLLTRPTVNFIATPGTGYAPLTVGFIDGSSGNPDTWNWWFGDGTWFNTTTASLRNPTYTYTSAGTYQVKLIACNAAGCDTSATAKTITVNLLNPPSVSFAANISSGNAPLTVLFVDASNGHPNMWNWSFGDGTWFNTTTASLRNPAYTYTSAGTYQVKLIACNAAGCDTSAMAKTITVS